MFAFPLLGQGQPFDRQVITLTAAAGKDDIFRFGTDKFCYLLPSLFNSVTRLFAPLMKTGRIAEGLAEERHHGFAHLGEERGSGGMV